MRPRTLSLIILAVGSPFIAVGSAVSSMSSYYIRNCDRGVECVSATIKTQRNLTIIEKTSNEIPSWISEEPPAVPHYDEIQDFTVVRV